MSGLIHSHVLSPGLVGILIKIIGVVKEKNKNEVHLQRDIDLTHNEYANAQKLHYFALIHRIKGKPGYYCITWQGGQFLRGELAMPHKVQTLDNRIYSKSIEKRVIKDYYPAMSDAWFQSMFQGIKLEQPSLL